MISDAGGDGEKRTLIGPRKSVNMDKYVPMIDVWVSMAHDQTGLTSRRFSRSQTLNKFRLRE